MDAILLQQRGTRQTDVDVIDGASGARCGDHNRPARAQQVRTAPAGWDAELAEERAVTTLPAKAGSFWLVPEAPVSAGTSRATLTVSRYLSARRLDPSPLSRTVYRDRFSPDPSGSVNATLTGERLTEPKLLGTRDMSIGLRPIGAFPVEPRKPIVRVKVPSRRCHTGDRLSSAALCSRSPSPTAIRIPLRA
jgi:hypothetical protein